MLEFDHVVRKTADVSALVAEAASLDRLRQEVARCEVVCVNCHRWRTESRRPSWRSDPSRIERSRRMTPGEQRNTLYVCEVLEQSACVDCGLGDLVLLEFDHVGRKRGNVTELARNGCSLEGLKDEIAQCEVRCGNCHRRRTRLDRRFGARAS